VSETHISDKVGKPRKAHWCRVCGEMIAASETCHIYRGVADGEGFYTLYFHPDCWEYSRGWDGADWECASPGDVSRREVREWLETESRLASAARTAATTWRG